MIKNIIFDFGGVLLDWNPRYLYKSYFNNDEEMEHFLADICNGEWNIKQDAGRPFAEAVKELQAKFPEYAEAIQMYDDDWEKMLKCELPGSIDLLKELKFMGYGIYGLTNWSAEKIGYAFANYSFVSLFDGSVVSGVEKVVTPDRKIYEILLEGYSLKPGECVFIDDTQDNVDMAKVLGINAIRFDNIGNVKEHLETLLNKQL